MKETIKFSAVAIVAIAAMMLFSNCYFLSAAIGVVAAGFTYLMWTSKRNLALAIFLAGTAVAAYGLHGFEPVPVLVNIVALVGYWLYVDRDKMDMELEED